MSDYTAKDLSDYIRDDGPRFVLENLNAEGIEEVDEETYDLLIAAQNAWSDLLDHLAGVSTTSAASDETGADDA